MTAQGAAMPRRKKISSMFKDSSAFSSFSVNDLKKAKEFYGETLGLEIRRTKGSGTAVRSDPRPSALIRG